MATIPDKMTFVLPLKINANDLGSDLERVSKILLPSLVKFFKADDIDQFLILVPAAEHARVSAALAGFQGPLKLTVIPEQKVLASVQGWDWHVLVHRAFRLLKGIDQTISNGQLAQSLKLNYSWGNLSGWLKQQWLKLAAVNLVRTDYYITLDADLCLIHPADFKALIPDGRAIMENDAAGTHFDWWTGSAKLLNIPLTLTKRDGVLSVTPEILFAPVVRRLLAYLQDQAKAQDYPTVYEYISANRGWTEYTLYWLYLLAFDKPENYYTQFKPKYQLHSDDSIWFRGKAPDQAALKKFVDSAFQESPTAGLFLIIQSTCIPFQEYYEAIKEHLV